MPKSTDDPAKDRANECYVAIEEIMLLRRYLIEFHGYNDERADQLTPAVAVSLHLQRVANEIAKLAPELVVTEIYKGNKPEH